MVPALFDKYISAVMEKSSDKLASLFSVNGRLSLPFRRNREVIVGRQNIRLHYANGFGVAPLRFTSIEDDDFIIRIIPMSSLLNINYMGILCRMENTSLCYMLM